MTAGQLAMIRLCPARVCQSLRIILICMDMDSYLRTAAHYLST